MSSSKLKPKFSIFAVRNDFFFFLGTPATKEHLKHQEAMEVNLDGDEPRLIKKTSPKLLTSFYVPIWQKTFKVF